MSMCPDRTTVNPFILDPEAENRDASHELARMVADSHRAMLEHDEATKGHASIRNAAIVRLHDVYGLALAEIAEATGVPLSIVRNAYSRQVKKGTTP